MSSENRSFTLFAVSVTSACESLFREIPAAKFEMSEMPIVFIPKM